MYVFVGKFLHRLHCKISSHYCRSYNLKQYPCKWGNFHDISLQYPRHLPILKVITLVLHKTCQTLHSRYYRSGKWVVIHNHHNLYLNQHTLDIMLELLKVRDMFFEGKIWDTCYDKIRMEFGKRDSRLNKCGKLHRVNYIIRDIDFDKYNQMNRVIHICYFALQNFTSSLCIDQ